ncbi:lysylphosphatidylglycerol synthase domain-containing protein [Aeromicrobium phragmitis]|uniref:lysylphosphatidylglycerol synthase domain-containing protein n=1 Tax=Aeromicrobium phragmitis TaxID=2478914 RepID=UPI001AA078D2|nr:lysylphosphatidylglycerol synthase domain-containing protein [Aeromicrobium phragmitis]
MAFLIVAVFLGTYAVMENRGELAEALRELHGPAVIASFIAGVLYIWCTMMSWRAVLTDFGSPLPLKAAVRLFGLSQIGKYIPGGIWNFLAAAEMGADHEIPRRRSVGAMAVSVLVSLMTGLALGAVAFVLSPADALQRWEWLLIATPLLMLMLLPPVMNRLIGVVLQVTRRPRLQQPLTVPGLGRAIVWAVLAWLVAGAHVSFLAVNLGMSSSLRTWALGTAAYALAWVAGFLVVISPAGVGVREAVLGASLAGAGMSTGQVLALVLLSRFLLTLTDFAFAAAGLASGRSRHPN